MFSIAKTMMVLSSLCLALYGAINLAAQYKSGGDIDWFYPIILIGFGFGLPVVINFPFSSHEEADQLDQYSESSVSDGSDIGTGSDGGEN